MLVYSLTTFSKINSTGFDFKIPDETIKTINTLSSQVGSPTYIKTPVFNKISTSVSLVAVGSGGGGAGGGGGGAGGGGAGGSGFTEVRKKRRGNNEVTTDEDWETLRTFQPTKIEQKNGIIDQIRFALNKMSDKNSKEHFDTIFELLDTITSPEDMMTISNSIFELASNNRFYSKLYADLYSKLIHKYEIMNTIFEENFGKFLELFANIQYVDSGKDYEKFCQINKDNEKRKSLSAFFVNLTINKILSSDRLHQLTFDLLIQLLTFIEQPDKKNEVDEICENIAILFNKKMFATCTITYKDMNILQIISMLSKSKVKTFPSITHKTIFKFMDIYEL